MMNNPIDRKFLGPGHHAQLENREQSLPDVPGLPLMRNPRRGFSHVAKIIASILRRLFASSLLSCSSKPIPTRW
jgi:hypothetical protein